MSKRSFKDTAGREYKIKITIPRLRMVRDELDLDLGTHQAFIGLSTNPIDFVNVLYLLVKGQADKYKLTDVQFGESFDGDVLTAAWEAFGQAYLSFCPSHRVDSLKHLMATAERTEHLSALEVDNQLSRLVESYGLGLNFADDSESNHKTIPLEN